MCEDLDLGPAVAPYPPPEPDYSGQGDSLVDNQVGVAARAR